MTNYLVGPYNDAVIRVRRGAVEQRTPENRDSCVGHAEELIVSLYKWKRSTEEINQIFILVGFTEAIRTQLVEGCNDPQL